jgi:predicted nucleic acid-binding protein
MAPVLLDTTALIDLLRNRPDAARRLRDLRSAGDTPYVCAVSVEEVVRGLRAPEVAAAEALFRGLRCVPLGEREGWQAGEWRRDHGHRGRTLPQSDCLIAAAATSIRARLVTGNPKDFPFVGLTVEHWPVGP